MGLLVGRNNRVGARNIIRPALCVEARSAWVRAPRGTCAAVAVVPGHGLRGACARLLTAQCLWTNRLAYCGMNDGWGATGWLGAERALRPVHVQDRRRSHRDEGAQSSLLYRYLACPTPPQHSARARACARAHAHAPATRACPSRRGTERNAMSAACVVLAHLLVPFSAYLHIRDIMAAARLCLNTQISMLPSMGG